MLDTIDMNTIVKCIADDWMTCSSMLLVSPTLDLCITGLTVNQDIHRIAQQEGSSRDLSGINRQDGY